MSISTITMLQTMQTFSEWINQKFVDWQAKQGRRKTVEEFAAYIGVSRPLLNMWLNGNKKPGTGNTELLAEIFGNDVYDVLGLPRPNPLLQIVKSNWEFTSEETQERVAREIAEEAAKYEAKKSTKRVHKASKQGKTGKD